VGFYVGITIVLGVVIGLWLDSRFHTEPILVIVGLLFGIFLAGFGLYRMLTPLMGDRKEKGDS
jgi:ATP synthase protein I